MTRPAEKEPASRSGDAVTRAILGVSLFVIIASAGLVLTFGHGRDQSIYALVAREMLAGKMPYRDAFDFKPPGIFLVYAIARVLFGGAQIGIRILEVASMGLTCFGLVRLSEMMFGKRTVGLMAGALASQVHAQLDFWHTAQPETFGGTLTIWALVLAFRGERTETNRAFFLHWVASGVLFGAAGLMKPPLAFGGAAIAGLAAIRTILAAREEKRALFGFRAWAPVVATAIGGALPIALVLGWFAAKGALSDMREVLLVFTPEYTKISWKNQSVLPMAYYGVKEWLMAYSSTLLLGLLLLLGLRPEKNEREGVIALLACIFVHIAGIVAQAKFFPYHWGATFPLTALLAALGFEKAIAFGRKKGPLVLGGIALGVLLIAPARCAVPNFDDWSFGYRSYRRVSLLVRPEGEKAWDDLASVADVNASENRAVAAFVRERTKPGDPIYVWGFECAIYDMAERPLSSRYIYNVPQRALWSAKPMQARLMKELQAKPPAAIVVELHDVFPMVTGTADDSAISLFKFPELRAMIERRYDFITRIGDFDIFLRREKDRGPDQEETDGDEGAP